MLIKQCILVTGKNGQLGNELQAIASLHPEYDFIFTDRETLDITNRDEVDVFFSKKLPQFCINAAAYTAVDKAETERDLAVKVNAEAIGYLSLACKKYSAKFIHISTDYVFDGTATEPYKEEDETNPVNFYGLTKLMGEELALSNHPGSIVIRTSWVYSSYGSNFVKTMLRLMSEKSAINVVNDQYGSPTYARDLAEAILQIIKSSTTSILAPGGIYHFSNSGAISWFDFASAIKEISASSCSVSPIPTSSYPTPAKRPTYSVFDKTKISTSYGIEIKDWEKSLQQCFVELRK
jgi:dTDP-4-dehydrorhamnose reductase